MAGPTVVVAGALANKPGNGGEAWVRLSWIRGLERLGCRVVFVEEIDEAVCTDAQRRPAPFATSANRAWFGEVTGRFGLTGRAGLVCRTAAGEDRPGEGLSRAALADIAAGADLLVNISGNLADPGLLRAFRRSAYVDIDPGYTQYWHAAGQPGGHLAGHDRYFTIGTAIGTPGCPIPTGGLDWIPVRPPVVLDDWPAAAPGLRLDEALRFTTVATWRGPYGPVETDRRRFGLKVHEFRRFIALPDSVDATFEAALAIHPAEVADLDLLRHHGWALTDPAGAAGTPEAFAAYVRSSGAEFSAAQGIYVETGSGWFSDRTTRYLASGRPALVQDTGFSAVLPTGKGLVAFSTLDEAISGARSILDDYAAHCEAARAVAESCFDSDTVLARFLEQCGL